MVRLYGDQFRCDHCHLPGPFGWVYRCTQDCEDIIEFAVSQGFSATFDLLGDCMTSWMHVRKRSATARAETYSLFEELTPDSMANYRPDQIATILRQRNKLRDILDSSCKRDHNVFGSLSALQGPSLDCNERLNIHNECDYQICPRCRPRAADRAYLSLDGVACGEVMPTAATGWGFHALGERPVVDAQIVRHIGHGSEHTHKSPEETTDRAPGYRTEFLDLLRGRIPPQLAERSEADDRETSSASHTFKPWEAGSRLKHSPGCENLAMFSEPDLAPEPPAHSPWTPPPSPSFQTIRQYVDSLNRFYQDVPPSASMEDVASDLFLDETDDQLRDMSFGRNSLTPAPLKLHEGIAFLEESAEIGIPDVIQQV